MAVGFNINNVASVKNNVNIAAGAYSKRTTNPSFKANNGYSPSEADAIKAQHIAAQNINRKQNFPQIKEGDINFAVTIGGHSQVSGNTREVWDYRCSMRDRYGVDWADNFTRPHLVRNGNIDEKRNGETTALVFPLHPQSYGLRGADNMTMVLNGNVPTELLNELIVYMAEAGILNANKGGHPNYFVNSQNPKKFMENPKIKIIIANFFREKKFEIAKSVNNIQDNNEEKISHIKESDINVSNIDCKQDEKNTRPVKDYLRYFLKNNKKFTVIYDKYSCNGTEKDMTAILVPSTKSEWDCITITIDKKIPEQDCKDMLNYLVKNNMANVSNKNFREGIVQYFERKDKS